MPSGPRSLDAGMTFSQRPRQSFPVIVWRSNLTDHSVATRIVSAKSKEARFRLALATARAVAVERHRFRALRPAEDPTIASTKDDGGGAYKWGIPVKWPIRRDSRRFRRTRRSIPKPPQTKRSYTSEREIAPKHRFRRARGPSSDTPRHRGL